MTTVMTKLEKIEKFSQLDGQADTDSLEVATIESATIASNSNLQHQQQQTVMIHAQPMMIAQDQQSSTTNNTVKSFIVIDSSKFSQNTNNTIQIIPNMNGDNTLLKQLLQTAPKNSVNFSNNPSIINNNSNGSSTKTIQIVQEIKPEKVDSSKTITNNNSLIDSIEAAISKMASLDDDDVNPKFASISTTTTVKKQKSKTKSGSGAIRTKSEKISSLTATTSMLSNSNSNNISSSSASAVAVDLPTIPAAVTVSSLPINNNLNSTAASVSSMSDDDVALKIYDYLRSTLNGVNSNLANVSHLRMAQPKQPMLNSLKNNLLPNYPGKVHSTQIAKTISRVNEDKGFFRVEIEHIKPGSHHQMVQSNGKMLISDNKRFVDFILNDQHHQSATNSSNVSKSVAVGSNPVNSETAKQQLTNLFSKDKLVKNYFKIMTKEAALKDCNVDDKNAMIDDSKERLNDLLELEDECINQIDSKATQPIDSATGMPSTALVQQQNSAIATPVAVNSSTSGSKSKKIINIINNLDKLKAAASIQQQSELLQQQEEAKKKQQLALTGNKITIQNTSCSNENDPNECHHNQSELFFSEYLKKKLKYSHLKSIETIETKEIAYNHTDDKNSQQDSSSKTEAEILIKYEAASPIIDLCSYENASSEKMEIEDQSAAQFNSTTKSELSTSTGGNFVTIKASIKLDRQAASNLKSTLKQLTNILAMECQPSTYDLGRLIKAEELKAQSLIVDQFKGMKKFHEQNELIKRQNYSEYSDQSSSSNKEFVNQSIGHGHGNSQSGKSSSSFIDRLLIAYQASLENKSEDSSSGILNLINSQQSSQATISIATESFTPSFQSLMNKYEKTALKFCKFCEAFLNDNINSLDLANLTNESSSSSLQLIDKENSSNSETGSKKNDLIKLCCSACTNSFRKLVRIKRILNQYQQQKQEQQQQQQQQQQAQSIANHHRSSSLNCSREDLFSNDESQSTILAAPSSSTSTLINSCLEAVFHGSTINSSSSSSSLSQLQQTSSSVIKRTSTASKRRSTSSEVKWFKWNSNLINNISNHAINLLQQKQLNSSSSSALICKFETLKPRLTSLNDIDQRVCCFCNATGDDEPNSSSRLLIMDLGKWCHLNCALWSDEVYETMNGALINVDIAYKKSANIECSMCKQRGASLKCFFQKCNQTYHFPCAVKDKCTFTHDKTLYCASHASKMLATNANSIEVLNDLSVFRNVWIERDEVAQIQTFVSRDVDEDFFAMRIGSLILHNIGQLLPHQLSSNSAFHNRDFIYPVGYKATRFYWSINNCYKRCRYVCCINENDGLPEFSVTLIEEDDAAGETLTMVDKSPTLIWNRLMEKLDKIRKENDLVKIFPAFLSGEYMFGLSEPHVIRLVESLPGVEMLTNYAFKYGRLQLLDMPLTINPSGCARSEPKLRTHFRKSQKLTTAHSSSSSSSSNGAAAASSSGNTTAQSQSNASSSNFSATVNDYQDDFDMDYDYTNSNSELDDYYKPEDGITSSYNKQFVLSKSTQYKKLKAEWRTNVFLAKSRIQGLGLYAARDLEKGSMIIEYIGDLIRNEVANTREKLYQEQNRGVYMFRLNDDFVVDATITGGLARYINHCCDPNCIAETVSLERDQKIIIIANKRILKGEELTYDYKFDFEDESNKISCLCGSANCKKWMN